MRDCHRTLASGLSVCQCDCQQLVSVDNAGGGDAAGAGVRSAMVQAASGGTLTRRIDGLRAAVCAGSREG